MTELRNKSDRLVPVAREWSGARPNMLDTKLSIAAELAKAHGWSAYYLRPSWEVAHYWRSDGDTFCRQWSTNPDFRSGGLHLVAEIGDARLCHQCREVAHEAGFMIITVRRIKASTIKPDRERCAA